ncbi:hypothetical protein FJTKL_12176 [Diaporthe vaccinii]|uniref:Uncharacterized protein n=1 Tax=Diaporthe vaccinii TaxID=105482 RepID=A0ABR4EEM6_9PEZI
MDHKTAKLHCVYILQGSPLSFSMEQQAGSSIPYLSRYGAENPCSSANLRVLKPSSSDHVYPMRIWMQSI